MDHGGTLQTLDLPWLDLALTAGHPSGPGRLLLREPVGEFLFRNCSRDSPAFPAEEVGNNIPGLPKGKYLFFHFKECMHVLKVADR